MTNPLGHVPPSGEASISDVIATLEQVRDEWTHVAMALRDLQFDLDAPERQAVVGKVSALLAKIQLS